MKALSVLSIGAGIFLIVGCATANHPSNSAPGPLPPAAGTLPTDHLWVISAVFGSGKKFADVTDRVDTLLHEPSAVFYARAPWLGVDPNPGWNKTLIIVYEFKGRRHIFTSSGGRVSLEEIIHHPNKG
jgi:hypothetical protein